MPRIRKWLVKKQDRSCPEVDAHHCLPRVRDVPNADVCWESEGELALSANTRRSRRQTTP